MASFSGNNDFFQIVSKVESLAEQIQKKKEEIENIKLEYGIDEKDIVHNAELDNIEEQSSN